MFNASGSVLKFDGFLKIYSAPENDDDVKNILPIVKIGDSVNIKEIIEGTANKLIPVGRAFKIFQDKYPQFSLLMEDDKHPNSNGSYLASCVIFSHISAESSMNLSKRYKGVDNKGVDIYYSIVEDEVLPFLQQVSDEVVF